jgi:hypothetical protein
MLGKVDANRHTFEAYVEGGNSPSSQAGMQPWLHHLQCLDVGVAAGTSPQQLPCLQFTYD